jgi:hypothetical protein
VRRPSARAVPGPNDTVRVKNWRARADECRAIAETFLNPETRANLLRLASDYDQMAEKAEAEDDERAPIDPGNGADGASR